MYNVTLHAGWSGYPVWFKTPDDPMHQHPVDEAAELLMLGDDLARDLAAWDDEYQDILDPIDARESAFPTPEAKKAWIQRGKELAARLKQESTMVKSVVYRADGTIPEGTCVF
ncbi:hypothetical protein [Actinoalloteichus hymeniacidonis]|uniref:Uncharacterized protein n=1 Tax=Actinoalloteichus hymeniacidonis TaxID=340345 RepID=A0AAC9HVF9_9PSEU|nr:hypothetical protein [Actinoalloteichus hymeniacidonis]AOS65270.1 hypothetical protein TL08_22440 [Actinoalloteichus hymeniacidonis]MBB5906648.1 inhibitor of KinA sporulation pathway (predicted exonuclease) [Actinoalloteichus hymeniacidonis]